jgi:hypothetical protein
MAKPLTKQQIEYGKKRIRTICGELLSKLRAKHTKGVPLTPKRRAELIRGRFVKLKSGVKEISNYDDVIDVFDFSPYEPKFNKLQYQKDEAIIIKHKTELLDKLVLSDSNEILEAISKFSKTEI